MKVGNMVKQLNYDIKELGKKETQDLVENITEKYSGKIRDLILLRYSQKDKELTQDEINEIENNIFTSYSKKIMVQEIRKLDSVVKDRDMEINGIGIEDVSSVKLENDFREVVEDLGCSEVNDIVSVVRKEITSDVIRDLNEDYKERTGRYLDEDKVENIKKVIIPTLGARNIGRILEEEDRGISEIDIKNNGNKDKITVEVSGIELKNLLKEDNNYWRVYNPKQDIPSEVFKNIIQEAIHRQGLSKKLIVLFDDKNGIVYLKRYPLISN